MEKERQMRQVRSAASEFTTREDGEARIIEGYFAVFNSNYEIGPGMTESIAPGAFSNTLGADVRALINHDSTLVLGRNKAGTLELREDSHGLWGKIIINPNDTDAMNLYSRVQRGDVNQCSFGFDILEEETDYLPNDSVHWTILRVKLYEVSVVTFPAYEETAVVARQREFAAAKLERWKETMRHRLKGE